MSTKMFCDYCAKEIDSYCGPLKFKCMDLDGPRDKDTARIFEQLCPGCYIQLREQFETFISGLGDNCHD